MAVDLKSIWRLRNTGTDESVQTANLDSVRFSFGLWTDPSARAFFRSHLKTARHRRMIFCLVVCLAMAHPTWAQEDPDKPAGSTDNRMLHVAESASRPSPVIPTPRETYWGKGKLTLGSNGKCACTVEVRGGGTGVAAIHAEFQKRLSTRFHATPASAGVKIVFAVKPSDEKAARQLATVGAEGYVIRATAI